MKHTTSFSKVFHTPIKQGVILPFLAIGFVLMMVMLIFTVDISYMQMVRTELRVATDVAAKAGVEALRRTRSKDKAIEVVKNHIAMNKVAGKKLTLSDEDILIGNSSKQGDGSWKFIDGGTPFNSIRVTSSLSEDNANGSVNLFFGKFFGNHTFTPKVTSTASNTEVEIVLCLDRSHSMCWDMTGTDWNYPPGIPKFFSFLFPPADTGSRWSALEEAVDLFEDVIKTQDPEPRVALVTWGSTIDNSVYEGMLTGLFFPATEVDETLPDPVENIPPGLYARGDKLMLGGTEMSSGIEKAIEELEKPYVNPLATRMIILFTDGKWTHGYDPVIAAQQASDKGIIMHTIGLLDDANADTTLQKIADLTGGRYLKATNETELEQAFIELSTQLPVVLID